MLTLKMYSSDSGLTIRHIGIALCFEGVTATIKANEFACLETFGAGLMMLLQRFFWLFYGKKYIRAIFS
jgi:hypothetical protein